MRALVRMPGRARAVLLACVRVTSRGLCVPVSLCWGWVRSLAHQYALSVLSSLRSSSPSVATLSSLSLVCGGGCAWVLAFFALGCTCLLRLPSLACFSLLVHLLSPSLFTLSTDSSSPIGRSSSWNLPLVPRGIIHHSFTIRIHSSCSRSFFSLLLVIF